MSSKLGKNASLVGVDDGGDNLFSDFATLETDFSNTFSDEYSLLKTKRNVYRILGAVGGVALVSLYMNQNTSATELGMKVTMAGVAEVISINFTKSMIHNDYVEKEDAVRAPTTALLYYLMSARSLDTNIRKRPAQEAIVCALGSYAIGYYLDMDSKKKSSDSKSKGKKDKN